MSVLVDASVWVDHFKQRDVRLIALMQVGLVVCHPYVVNHGRHHQLARILSLAASLEHLVNPAHLLLQRNARHHAQWRMLVATRLAGTASRLH